MNGHDKKQGPAANQQQGQQKVHGQSPKAGRKQ